MKIVMITIMLILIVVTFIYNLFGLLGLVPLYVSSPLLFLALFILLFYINNRKKFKGF
ncbi:hypothetical protein [Neobacillus sp. LXY-4]|uniref:hypothetical protein n=1 Tax=Neobacillus sp. LXY-4 TaxID=3379826 RepID=UPI003EE0FAB4